jgi:hypothetical protein
MKIYKLLLFPIVLASLTGSFLFASKAINLLSPKQISLNKNWTLKKGILTPSETPGGIIWSKNKFGDFTVSLEYKTSKKANSGLFFRTDPKNAVQGGFEIQIASPGLYSGKHIVGSLYDAKAPIVAAGKPDGEWNTMELTCKGPLIKAKVNGKKVIDLNIDDWNEPNKNPDGSKNKFKTALKDLPRTGNLGLQYHGQPVWFRNIKVTSFN